MKAGFPIYGAPVPASRLSLPPRPSLSPVALAIESEAGRMVGAARGDLEAQQRAADQAAHGRRAFPSQENLCADAPFDLP